MICILKFAKRNTSVKSVGGVMVLVLFTSSDNALYLYQVLPKISYGFRVPDLNSRVNPRVVINVDGSLYRALPEAGTTKTHSKISVLNYDYTATRF